MVLILANKIITIFMCITQAENDMNISDHALGQTFQKLRSPVIAMTAGQTVF